MPTPENISLQVVVNGGAPATGVVTAAFSDAVVLKLADSSGVRRAKYRIYEYPEGFACPAGWTAGTLAYELVVANGGPTPSFALPASDPDLRGQYLFDVEVNGRLRAGVLASDLYDNSSLIEIPFAATQLKDVAYLIDKQGDPKRGWAGSLKALIRYIDQVIISGGTGDVIGPGTSVAGNLPMFSGGTGKLLADSGLTVSAVVIADGSVPMTGDLDLDGNSLANVKAIAFEEEYDNGSSGATKTITMANGAAQKLTMTADCAVTVTPAGVGGALLKLVQGTGPWAVSSWTTVDFGDAGDPTLPAGNGDEFFVSLYHDGVKVYGSWGSGAPSSGYDPDAVSITVNGGGDLQRAALSGVVSAAAGSNVTAFVSGDFVALPIISTDSLQLNDAAGYIRLGLVSGSGSGVASAASAGLLRFQRGNNVLAMVRREDDAADIECLRWNSPSSALTFGGANTQTRMNAATLTSLQVGGTDLFYVTAGRVESALSFYFKDTATGATFGQVARTGATAGGRVTYSGQATVDGASGPARLLGGSASGSGAGGDVELIPGSSGSSTAGNIVEGVVPGAYNGMQLGKFVGVAIAIPTAGPSTTGRYVYNISAVGWVTWSSGGIVSSLAPGSSVALVNSKTQALVGVTGAAGKATTNATPDTVSVVDLSAPGFAGAIDNAGVTVTLNAEITVRGGTDVASIRIRRRFKRMSGTITAGAAATSLFSDIDAGIAGTVALDLTFSGNVIQAGVTGKAATNLDWVLSWSIDSTGV